MPPRALIVVRHGESEHHIRKLTGGWTDTPLTPRGHEQAHLVAMRLFDELSPASVRVFTSDLLRASGTATHIVGAFGVEAVVDARLREHNNGESANMTIAEARERFPGPRDMRMGTRMSPSAETGAEFYARARAFVESLEEGDALPITVTHGGTMRMIVAAWLGMSEDALEYAHFASLPTGITVLLSYGEDGRERMVERANDVAHLSGGDSWTALRDVIA